MPFHFLMNKCLGFLFSTFLKISPGFMYPLEFEFVCTDLFLKKIFEKISPCMIIIGNSFFNGPCKTAATKRALWRGKSLEIKYVIISNIKSS